MAVTVTADELRNELRLGEGTLGEPIVDRLLAYVQEAIPKRAPSAPEAVMNRAAIVLAGHLFDKPLSTSPLRYSGAASILAPYRVHRAIGTRNDE